MNRILKIMGYTVEIVSGDNNSINIDAPSEEIKNNIFDYLVREGFIVEQNP